MKRITYYDFLDIVQEFSSQKDWDGLEFYFNQYCERFVSAEFAAKIKDVNLNDCGLYLTGKATEALMLAKKHNVKAVYYEYNVQQGWESGFYICPEYNPITEQDDDWAANFIPLVGELEGFEPQSDMDSFEFSEFLYECETLEERTVVEYYLIARTTALFGRAIQGLDWGNIVVCSGFHDQQIVTRIYEPLNVKVEG